MSANSNSVAKKFGYLGQEHQDELGLGWISYKWRNADPALGRFFGSDPIAEDYYYQTNYQFASNNPIWKIEIEGLEGQKVNDGTDLNDDSPWYINQVGSKKVLTLGLHNIELGTLDRLEGWGPVGFVENSLRSAWNSVATTWNQGMDGGTLGDMTADGIAELGNTVSRIENGEGTIEDAENLTGDAIITIAAIRVSTARGSNSTNTNSKKAHGNSKNSTNAQHGYEIVNETKGTRHKVGVSGGKLNKNGSSRRANSQVSRLNKQKRNVYSARVIKTIEAKANARQRILDWEQNQVNQHYKKTGTNPPGQKRPKPNDN